MRPVAIASTARPAETLPLGLRWALCVSRRAALQLKGIKRVAVPEDRIQRG